MTERCSNSVPFRFWFLAFPDIKKPIGGVKQIHRVSEIISSFGFQSVVVQQDASFSPSWFTSEVSTISKSDFYNRELDKNIDIIVLPETFIAGLDSINPSIPKIIFNQNAGYTFGINNVRFPSPPEIFELYQHPSVLQVWCVSEFDRAFVSKMLRVPISKVHRLYNSVETHTETIPDKKNLIAYMPRKNKDHSEIVINLVSKQSFLEGWKFVPISGFSHQEVLKIFSASRFFLPFGYPEGFGLPIAEALSCACSIVGYDGLGGKELFNLASRFGCSKTVDYGDYFGFVDGISSLIRSYDLNPLEYIYQSTQMSRCIRSTYSYESMKNSVLKALNSLTV